MHVHALVFHLKHKNISLFYTHLMDAFVRLKVVQSHKKQEYEEVLEVV